MNDKEKDDLQRKITLTLGVCGQGNDRLNVLINCLAHATLEEDVEAASVIHHYCSCVLSLIKKLREERDDGEDDCDF